MLKRVLVLTAAVVSCGIAVAAQQAGPKVPPAAKAPMSAAAKIRYAMAAAPTDIAKGATVMDMDDKGTMKSLRAGTNGWMCMLIPVGQGDPEAMCMDKTWSSWADAYMSKKNPSTKTMGVAYMLRGDHGASNTDPFATGPTATNQWVVSPAHVMLLVPDAKMLDTLPTDPQTGGPWVMWKGTPYAHIMVPMAAVSAPK